MIPILYAGNEQNFTNNGLGRLSDAISCKVTEERNGIFELEMTYPITGIHYKDVALNRIILAKTEEGGSSQAFIIYSITRPLDGIVTIKANHISYLLNGFVVMPFEAVSLADAMSKLNQYSVVATPFTFYTDVSSSVRFSFDTPRSIRSLLGGEQGSLLDTYGGYDYRFNNFQVSLLADRGNDNGVVLRYGKNLTELKNLDNTTNIYTGIVPYWKKDTKEVYLSEKVVLSEHASDYPYKIIKTVDFSQEFENEPSQAQLRAKAQSYLANNKGWALKNNIEVSFAALWQSEEYKDIAALERVRMCDTVRVVYSKLGVDIKTRVIKTVYNVLLDRYDSISLGDATYNLKQAIQDSIMEPQIQKAESFTRDAVARATKLIQGGLGGHVVFNTDGNGEPQEILIMDTDDIATAVNVIRMNLNGIGFSHNGYNGPFETAWTIDGSFVANFITSGALDAALITVGILKDKQNKNYWNMATGDFKLSAGAQIGNSNVASTQNISDSISSYNNSLDQRAVFNKLTNNEQNQGIYLENTKLYVNGEYIKANTIAAEALTVDAREILQEKHSYIEDAFTDITKWHNDNGTVSFAYQTINGVKYLVMDCTRLSASGTWGDAVYTPIKLIGTAEMTAHFVYYIDRQVTIASAQRFPCIKYKKTDDETTWYNSKNITPQTIPANTEFEWNTIMSPSDADPNGSNAFGFYPIQGAKVYFKEISVTSTVDIYSSAGIVYNAEGFTSTVKKGDVISSINQSPERVSINANKIDLTGSLALHGEFTTDQATNPDYQGYTAKLDAATLTYYDANNRKVISVGPYYDNGLKHGIYIFDNQGAHVSFTEDRLYAKDLIIDGDVRVQNSGTNTFSCGINSTFWEDVTFKDYVYFENNVYDRGGTVVIISDKRKKRSIKDLVIEKARSFIMGLKPRAFKFTKDISKSDRYHHGFIAQEVNAAMDEDWGVYVEDQEKDFIGLRYDEFMADIVSVIQDQEKRIQKLEKVIRSMKGEEE